MRNSECLYLMVLYTGNDTKLILNQGKTRFKQSQLDKIVNKVLLFNIVFMLTFSSFLAYFNYLF